MKLITTLPALNRFRSAQRNDVVLVPTMGALHEGHANLMRRARRAAGKEGSVVVSIFVNPTQFGPNEDFTRYPRPLADDLALCRQEGVDAVFAPEVPVMYPGGESVAIIEEKLSGGLCGRSRPGHFRGVCTVVAKLFNMVRPHAAVFGEKDYQQLAIIRQMVRDLNFPVKIIPAKTVREADGLAISSRNRYLSEQEREQAPVLRKALLKAVAAAKAGKRSAKALEALVRSAIGRASLARIDYVEVVDAQTLEPINKLERPALIALAVFFGKTRLIDNVVIE